MIALEMYSDFEYIIFLAILQMSLGMCWANCKLDLKLANALNWEGKYFGMCQQNDISHHTHCDMYYVLHHILW